VIFYAIYKNQEKGNTIGVTVLQERPWKELYARNVVPGAAGRRGWAKFRRTSPGFGRGRAGEGPRGAKGLILGAAGGEERSGNGGRQRSGRLAAAAFGLASLRPGREDTVVLGGWGLCGTVLRHWTCHTWPNLDGP
jgi:hypothetical protein